MTRNKPTPRTQPGRYSAHTEWVTRIDKPSAQAEQAHSSPDSLQQERQAPEFTRSFNNKQHTARQSPERHVSEQAPCRQQTPLRPDAPTQATSQQQTSPIPGKTNQRANAVSPRAGATDTVGQQPAKTSRYSAAAIAVAAILVAVVALEFAFILTTWTHDTNSTHAASSLAISDIQATSDDIAAAEPSSITVAAVGDMIFGRNVGELIDAKGGAAPLADVAETLAAADVTIGNLESCLSDDGDPDTDKDVILIGRPEAIESLVSADFTFVSLANNHMLDYGKTALVNTLDALDDAGIKHAGAGLNYSEARKAATAEVEGKIIGFLSYSDILPAGFVADEDSAGIAAARTDMDQVCEDIATLKEQCDYVFVSFHWGVEYEDYINNDQQDEAHQAVDAGATAVFSEHPHVIQGVEFYKGAVIAYSLGDFVFDHYSQKTGESFILQLELTDNGIENVTATPAYLDENGAPSIVTGEEAKNILDRLDEISDGMNMTMVQKGSIGYLSATDAATTADSA